MLSIKQALDNGTKILKNLSIESANLDSKILLLHTIDKTQEYLISRPDERLTDFEEAKFFTLIERRANLEPIAYIIGYKEFYGYNFYVNDKVLIPRPDTEVLVDAIIREVKESNITNPLILELGIGSGCVSISLLLEIESANIIASEISLDAILVSNQNAQIHSVSNRLKIIHSNWFDNINEKKFDIIFSNPPYIPKSEAYLMGAETIRYEPHNALFMDNNEFNPYQYIAKDAKSFLKENGKLFLEVGFNQASSIIQIFESQDFVMDKIYKDFAGHKRVVSLKLP